KESIHSLQRSAVSGQPIPDHRSLREKFLQSEFLRDFRDLARRETRGCIVLERPDLLKQLVEKHGARDSTARGTALAELASMERRTSQHNRGHDIPEKNWLYRLAKRFWFNDFGVYEGYNHGQAATNAHLM